MLSTFVLQTKNTKDYLSMQVCHYEKGRTVADVGKKLSAPFTKSVHCGEYAVFQYSLFGITRLRSLQERIENRLYILKTCLPKCFSNFTLWS